MCNLVVWFWYLFKIPPPPIYHPYLFILDTCYTQLSKDPFMKQVQYGSQLTSILLTMEGERILSKDLLRSSLVAQLSHSDGIRGFMVSFLTRDDNRSEDQEIPALLLDALVNVNNPKELVPLACKLKSWTSVGKGAVVGTDAESTQAAPVCHKLNPPDCLFSSFSFLLIFVVSCEFIMCHSLSLNRHERYHANGNDHHAPRSQSRSEFRQD
jgi:hypothetical protein